MHELHLTLVSKLHPDVCKSPVYIKVRNRHSVLYMYVCGYIYYSEEGVRMFGVCTECYQSTETDIYLYIYSFIFIGIRYRQKYRKKNGKRKIKMNITSLFSIYTLYFFLSNTFFCSPFFYKYKKKKRSYPNKLYSQSLSLSSASKTPDNLPLPSL